MESEVAFCNTEVSTYLGFLFGLLRMISVSRRILTPGRRPDQRLLVGKERWFLA
jgi:hypothetical protein